jgi:hypothetical protein
MVGPPAGLYVWLAAFYLEIELEFTYAMGVEPPVLYDLPAEGYFNSGFNAFG